MKYFICFRVWPSFGFTFPFERFERVDELGIDKQLGHAAFEKQLEEFARGALRANKALVIKERQFRRTKLRSAIKNRQAMFSPRPRSHRKPTKSPIPTPGIIGDAIRGCERNAPLVCKVGAYLGWWGNRGNHRMPNNQATSELQCLFCLEGDGGAHAAAQAVAADLNERFAKLSDLSNLNDDTMFFVVYPARFFLVEETQISEVESYRLVSNCRRLHSVPKLLLAESEIASYIAKEAWDSIVSPLLRDDPELSLHAPRIDSSSRRDATMASGSETERKAVPTAIRLLCVFTNGITDELFKQAVAVLESPVLTIDEKLWQVDMLIKIPPSVSAEKLGGLLNSSKTAVQKSTWYQHFRKGRKDEELELRKDRHQTRSEQMDCRGPDGDE